MDSQRPVARLSPYASLVLILVPLLIVEPLKIAALLIAGKGHWLTGTAVMVAAYAASLLLVERLFRALRPNLMKLRWFARVWDWTRTRRTKLSAWLPRWLGNPGCERKVAAGARRVDVPMPRTQVPPLAD